MSREQSNPNSAGGAGWTSSMRGFRSWLELERGLSSNSVEAYLRDVQRLSFFAQNLSSPAFTPGEFAPEHVEFLVSESVDVFRRNQLRMHHEQNAAAFHRA